MAEIRPSRRRLQSIFPPGFDSVSVPVASDSIAYSKHYTHSTEQMKGFLVDNYNYLTPSDTIVVKSAWYGKQTTAAKHEFLLLHVEDKGEMSEGAQPMLNYLILDRNAAITAKHTKLRKAFRQSQTTSQSTQPSDAFRVSYDGDSDRLVGGCNLLPNRLLEQLEFPTDKPLYLYELAVLADVVSTQYPTYHAIEANCYLFAGVIWDSLCELYPGAVRHKVFEWERGKNALYEFTVTESQVKAACKSASEKILQAKAIINEQRAAFEAIINYRIAKGNGVTTPSIQGPAA